MKTASPRTEDSAVRSLAKKRDVRVYPERRAIYLLSNKAWSDKLKKTIPNPAKVHDLGNGSWGRIDYLCKVHRYRKYILPEFKK